MRSWLARISLAVNRITGGERGQYLCARLAIAFGPYSLPCRLIDRFAGRGHCRSQAFDWNYRK